MEATRTDQPRVTLVVAMRNEQESISATLQSIAEQDYPETNLEVIVVDGMSTDGSVAEAEALAATRPLWRVVQNPDVISACAWNVGIREATGDLIGIVSGHCILAEDYVSRLVETLARTGADLAGGPMRAVSSTVVGKAIAMATSSPFGVGDASFHYMDTEGEVDTVYQGMCHKSLYERIGGFDPEMRCNEDDELSFRILAGGGRIVCNPAVASFYRSRSTLARLWRQYWRYGFWKVRLMQKCAAKMRLRHFVPGLFAGSAMVLLILGFLYPWAWRLWAAMVAVYGMGAVIAALAVARSAGSRVLLVVPFVFPVLHLGYGFGFLAGLAYWPWQPRPRVAGPIRTKELENE